MIYFYFSDLSLPILDFPLVKLMLKSSMNWIDKKPNVVWKKGAKDLKWMKNQRPKKLETKKAKEQGYFLEMNRRSSRKSKKV